MSYPILSLNQDISTPLYFSVILTTAFYGISCVQTFYYYIHYPNDSRRMKWFVAIIWALDTVHEALTVSGGYKYFMAALANPLSMLDDPPEFVLQLLSEVSVTLPTQAFFVYRIYIFSGKSLAAPLLWGLPAIYQLVGAIIYQANVFYSVDGRVQTVGLIELDDSFFRSLALSSLAVSAVTDVLIAAAMTFLLLRQRSTIEFARTAHVLQRLTMFAVNTGLWTAIIAVLSAILMSALPWSGLYGVFSIPLGSIYPNTLLANLNARAYIREEATTQDAGGDSDLIFTFPMPSHVRTEKQSTRFSSAVRLNMHVQKATEATPSDGSRSITREDSIFQLDHSS